eukprot:jgi/Psemu1/43382/gm1.43382_g
MADILSRRRCWDLPSHQQLLAVFNPGFPQRHQPCNAFRADLDLVQETMMQHSVSHCSICLLKGYPLNPAALAPPAHKILPTTIPYLQQQQAIANMNCLLQLAFFFFCLHPGEYTGTTTDDHQEAFALLQDGVTFLFVATIPRSAIAPPCGPVSSAIRNASAGSDEKNSNCNSNSSKKKGNNNNNNNNNSNNDNYQQQQQQQQQHVSDQS